MEQNTPFYKKLLDFKNLPLESKIYIGTILILLIYVGSTIPLIVRAFSKTNTITVDGKTYSIENLEKEKPQIFNK